AMGVATSSIRCPSQSPPAPRNVARPLSAETPAPVNTATRLATRRSSAARSNDFCHSPILTVPILCRSKDLKLTIELFPGDLCQAFEFRQAPNLEVSRRTGDDLVILDLSGSAF